MQAIHKKHPGGLELSRLTLASLAVWLAVTCLVAGNRMPAGTVTAAAVTTGRDATIAAAEPGDFPSPRNCVCPTTPTDEIVLNTTPVALIETTVLAAVAVAPTGANRFVFPEDVGGQLLSAKLVPPARFEVWPVPYVSEPEPWRTLKLDPLPRDISALTRTIIRQEPSTTALAARAGLSLRLLDLPGLPTEFALSAPTSIQVHPLPRSYAPSADANAVPFLAVAAAPPKEKLDPAANPARSAAEFALFQVRLLAASLPTAFVKLALPDPFVQVREVQLTTKLPDFDPALFPAGQPSRPNFPVIEAPGEAKK
jgi:hypothetical protein